MGVLTLTREQARRFLTLYHGLADQAVFTGKAGIVEYLRRVGCIQYDPLNVVGQNPELVLQSRIAGFERLMLRELLYQDFRLVDLWDKNMSIVRVEDWLFFGRFRSRYQKWCTEHAAVVTEVRNAIREKGPLCSGDFALNEKVQWYYGPTRLARAALEGMCYAGQLVVHHKQNTRKYYDLAERHIPPELLTASEPHPTQEQYWDWFVLRRIGSVGMLWRRPSDAWLGVHGFVNGPRDAAFEHLLQGNRIREIAVEGVKYPLYVRSEVEPILQEALENRNTALCAKILAPLDNLIWDRSLVRDLFGFEYRWEVYKPVAQRQYGYYVLPVLYGDRLVARFEPEKYRKREPFTVKQWWWEPDVAVTPEMREAVRLALNHFADFLGAQGEYRFASASTGRF